MRDLLLQKQIQSFNFADFLRLNNYQDQKLMINRFAKTIENDNLSSQYLEFCRNMEFLISIHNKIDETSSEGVEDMISKKSFV